MIGVTIMIAGLTIFLMIAMREVKEKLDKK